MCICTWLCAYECLSKRKALDLPGSRTAGGWELSFIVQGAISEDALHFWTLSSHLQLTSATHFHLLYFSAIRKPPSAMLLKQRYWQLALLISVSLRMFWSSSFTKDIPLMKFLGFFFSDDYPLPSTTMFTVKQFLDWMEIKQKTKHRNRFRNAIVKLQINYTQSFRP